MTTARVMLPPKLVPVFSGSAEYRGAFGGRGSAKTRSFAKMAAVWGYKCAEENRPGLVVCGREFMNSLSDSSFAEVRAAIESEPWLADFYDVGEKYIRTRDGRVEFAFVGLRHNLDSIKSKALIRVLWVDEAEPVTEGAWEKAIPTVREDGSEIWVTWNPERQKSATHQRFRVHPPTDSKIVELNWRDNPWMPLSLNKKRLDDKAQRPDQYDHVWEGGFVQVVDGAYYAKSLAEAKAQRRIGNVGFDPLMRVRVFCDLGGTGARADAFAMWPAQFIGREIRVRDSYEAQGQQLAEHIHWLHSKGYGPKRADIYLPHDGRTNDRVFDVSFESAFREAGYDVTVVENQGTGAAKMRVEAVRRVFPMIWFDETTTESGREALGWYHEKRSNDHREVGMGPEHDWCLSAGTQVLTPLGWRSVETLSVHDQVLSPCGPRRIIRSGIVRETDGWVTVRGIRCTPEHRFFTSRGLVQASELSGKESLWTRESLGLSILAFLCATFRSGLKTAITSATPAAKENQTAAPCSFIGWFMRLCTVQYRTAMKSITSTIIRSITAPTTLRPSVASITGARINPHHDISASAAFAARNSAAIRRSGTDVAQRVSAPTAHGSPAKRDPAYNLTVDVDECYFVRGNDGRAYLVSNSSHSADAFGLMAVAYEMPADDRPAEAQPRYRGEGSWMR